MATAKPKSKTPPKAKPKINYNFDSRNESAKEYNQRIGIARGESQSAIDKRNKGTEKVFKDKGLDANKKNGGQSIQAANIGTTSPVIPPKPQVPDTGDMLGMNNASVLQEGLTLDGGQFVKDPNASDVMNATKEANANMGNIASQVLGYLKPEANQAQNAYEDTYGITSRQAGREYRRAQQDVQQYTSQLNSITSSRDAAVLALEDTGRGQTTGFIGGEQGRIQRQAAIAALPVQAQLAAAQGNLEIAKSHVDSLFQMKIKDIETEQAYKQTVANTWMSVANQQQSNLLNAAIADSNARAEAKKIAMNDAKQIAMQAIEYGQSSLAASVMKLDPTSPTYQQDVMNAMAGLRKPVSASDTGTWSQIDDGNGGKLLLNNKTGETKALTGDPSTDQNIMTLANVKSGIDTIDAILNSPALDSVVGTSILSRGAGTAGGALARFASGAALGGATGATAGSVIPGVGTLVGGAGGALIGGTAAVLQGGKDAFTGDRQTFIGDVQKMTAGLTLQELATAKARGVTFGALSAPELQTVADAASKIAGWAVKDGDRVIGYNASEKAFKKEIDTINNMRKLDFILKGGDPNEVGVRIMDDLTYWVVNSDGTKTQLK